MAESEPKQILIHFQLRSPHYRITVEQGHGVWRAAIEDLLHTGDWRGVGNSEGASEAEAIGNAVLVCVMLTR